VDHRFAQKNLSLSPLRGDLTQENKKTKKGKWICVVLVDVAIAF
jgi:hypothetical protein